MNINEDDEDNTSNFIDLNETIQNTMTKLNNKKEKYKT